MRNHYFKWPFFFNKMHFLGCLGALSVEPQSVDFGSGHDLLVYGIEPRIGLCADSAESAWDSLSLFLSVPLLLMLSLSRYINKL